MALSIFTQLIGDKCDNPEMDKDSNNHCNPLKRLSAILNIYHKLDIVKNQLHQNMFMQLMTTMYTSFLDDFNHLLIKHKDHLQNIHESMTAADQHGICDIERCKFTMRRFGDDGADKSQKMDTKNEIDGKFRFYKNTVDSLHFYIFHLYDLGMRIKDNEYNDEQDENDDDMKEVDKSIKYELYFKRVRRMISDRSQIGLEFDRFQSNHNKFNISGDNNKSESKSDGKSQDTFMDTLLTKIEDYDYEIMYIPTKTMKKFKMYLLTEEYDSEAIFLDIEQDKFGNLKIAANDENLYEIIADFVLKSKGTHSL